MEFFHAITDGTGGTIFLKTLLAEYLCQKYGITIPAEDGVLGRLEEPDEEELEDSFLRYAGDVKASRKEATAYHLSGTPEPDGFLDLTTLMLPVDAVKAKAKEFGVSVTEFIAWMGRMELVSNDPFFLMDGAHNSNGVEALKKSLETMYPDEKFHFIMGVMADKDYGEMIRELLPLALDFKTVTVESERALQGEALADCIRAKGIPAEAYQNLADVLPDFSKSSAEKTVAFGSLYFIGEIEAFLRGKQ